MNFISKISLLGFILEKSSPKVKWHKTGLFQLAQISSSLSSVFLLFRLKLQAPGAQPGRLHIKLLEK